MKRIAPVIFALTFIIICGFAAYRVLRSARSNRSEVDQARKMPALEHVPTVKVEWSLPGNNARGGPLLANSHHKPSGSLLLAPLSAMFTRNNKKYVYLVVENKIGEREVATGSQHGDKIEIQSGLSSGDIIVRDASHGPPTETRSEPNK